MGINQKKYNVDNKKELIRGTVEKFLFSNTADHFVVFVLLAKNFSTVVTGYLPGIQEGQEVELTGIWATHQKFGKQFQAETCCCRLPATVAGLKKYLASGLIKGVGKVYAEKMVDHFGMAILDIIENEPKRLLEIEGIGQKRVDAIISAWQEQRSVASIMVFLQEKGVSPAYAAKIYKRYGNEAFAVLQENPYRLADDIWGIGFSIADTIARNMGFAENHPLRIAAGVLFALSQQTGQGHLYVELENLRTHTLQLLQLAESEKPLLKNGLHRLYEQGKITVLSENNGHYVGLTMHYNAEKSIAERLLALLATPAHKSIDSENMYQILRSSTHKTVHLNELQQQGIMSALTNTVTIITGGPGTGKTTLVRSLLGLLDKENIVYKLAAPTGRAAKRITESTGRYAMTIHRLLEFDPHLMHFTRNEQNTLKLDFLIIDESSMIDTFLMNAIIKAMPLGGRLLFIGDSDQLPSVGPGCVLHDMLNSKKIPSIHLTEIFRQAQDSLIITNAHKVNCGEFPAATGEKKDFFFMRETDPEKLPDHLQKIIAREAAIKKIAPHDIQILTPMNRGAAGTQNLNRYLQQLFNPGQLPYLSHAGTQFKEGDRVMQLRNNYDKNVFNGDMGIVKEVDLDDKILFVQFGELLVEYTCEDLDEISLSYAVSIHKSQGSEYPVVIIPLFMQHFMLLQRNLLYTAITRAKTRCFLIGDPRAIGMAVKKATGTQRVTFLKKLLQADQNTPQENS